MNASEEQLNTTLKKVCEFHCIETSRYQAFCLNTMSSKRCAHVFTDGIREQSIIFRAWPTFPVLEWSYCIGCVSTRIYNWKSGKVIYFEVRRDCLHFIQVDMKISIVFYSTPVSYCSDMFASLNMMLDKTKLWLVTLPVSQKSFNIKWALLCQLLWLKSPDLCR